MAQLLCKSGEVWELSYFGARSDIVSATKP